MVRFDSIASTSLHARELIEAGHGPTAPTVYVARRQTGGVGRLGRAYCCPEGGVWLTVVVPFAGAHPPADVLEGLGLRLGTACVAVVWGALGTGHAARVQLKWPNDVLVGGRKVLGLLTEVVRGPVGGRACALCVGVGVNANFGVEELDAPLRATATTLRDERGGRDVDLAALERELVAGVLAAVAERGVPPRVLAAARAALHGVGEAATITASGGEAVRGVLLGLDERGYVRVRTATGEEFVGVMPVAG